MRRHREPTTPNFNGPLMTRRYQVFISSTYEDLKAERQAALQAVLHLNCFPSGMELFPTADESSWTLIKRMIDACDYYVLIVGGRYGSIGKGGMSYTEMEYEYAKNRKPILSFLHGEPERLASNRTESDPRRARKLAAFRAKVQRQQCQMWSSKDDLRASVTQSLAQLIDQRPARGWMPTPLEAIASTGRIGLTLIGAVRTAGLVDIEVRDSGERTLPPEEFLRTAEHEILMTGPTLYTILKASAESTHIFEELLSRGVRVKLLMLHPSHAASDLKALGKRVGKRYLIHEVEEALGYVARQRLHQNRCFELRFAKSIATFNAVLIDGDVEGAGKIGRKTAQIRVQPLNTAGSTHKGIVLQFRQSKPGQIGGYENFAEDVILQWKGAKPDPSLIRN